MRVGNKSPQLAVGCLGLRLGEKILLVGVLLGVLLGGAPSASADVVNLGVVTFTGFIPGVPGGPGTFSIEIDNLTGLPPDFLADPIDFSAVNLELVFADSATVNCAVGALGSLQSNTDCQVPETSSLMSVLATGSFPAITSQDGHVFSSFSTILTPSAPGDFALISVGTRVPEPSSMVLLLAGLLGLAVQNRRRA